MKKKIKIIPLTIKEVLSLYNILGKYLPDALSDTVDVLEYHNSILDKIILDEKPEAYTQALSLMSKKTITELLMMDKYDRSSLFIKCIAYNRLWEIKDLMRRINYDTPNR